MPPQRWALTEQDAEAEPGPVAEQGVGAGPGAMADQGIEAELGNVTQPGDITVPRACTSAASA